MSSETKEAILYGQLQEGLRLELLRGPAVLGALGYKELCVAAKGEERRLLELKNVKHICVKGTPSGATSRSQLPLTSHQ